MSLDRLVASKLGAPSRRARRDLDLLAAHLQDEEVVLTLATGQSNAPGVLAVTTDRLLFAMSKKNYVFEAAHSSIVACEAKDAMLKTKDIKLDAPGATKSGQVTFTTVEPRARAAEICDLVRAPDARRAAEAAIGDAPPPPVPTKEASGHMSVAGFTVDPDVQPVFDQLRDRVKKALGENLSNDEPVRAVIRGSAGQTIVGTDRRAFVCKPGWMAGATLGAEVTSYNYLNVTGVQLHKGIMSGTVAVETGQQMARTSIWKDGDKDTYKAPNAIPVQGDWDEVRINVARLRELVDAAHTPMITRHDAAAGRDDGLAAELEKVAGLREKGLLTQAEFDAAKSRLLGS